MHKKGVDILAINGGKPVRKKPLPGPYPGALMIGKEEERAVIDVLRSKTLFRYYGPKPLWRALEFEKVFAQRMGCRFALGVNSGSSALRCALVAIGVGEGDEVLVPAYSYIATAHEVLACGARPVFVEINETMCIDPDDLMKKIGPKTKAVTPVHLFGQPCDMDAIMKIAKDAGLKVVEDCAQSCGASFRGKMLGTFGDVGIFSFQLNKVITAGEGGAVVTDNPEIYYRAVRHHDHGNYRVPGNLDTPFNGEPTIGENLRMSEITAAILIEQLKKMDRIIADMRASKAYILEHLSQVNGLKLCPILDPEGDAGAAVMVLCPSSDIAKKAVLALQAEGIRAIRQYNGMPLYAYPQLKNMGFSPCPRTEDIAGRSIMLGLTTGLKKNDLMDIVKAFKKVFSALCG